MEFYPALINAADKSGGQNQIGYWNIYVSCGIGALVGGFYFLEESITEKSVDRGDEIGGADRFMFMAGVGCYARGYLVLDTVFPLVWRSIDSGYL